MLKRDTKFKIVMLLPLALLSGYFLLLVGSQATFFRFDDFISQISHPDIRSAILLSLLAATISSGIAITLAMPAAYALARIEFRGKQIVDTLIDLPMVLTPIALGTLILGQLYVFGTTTVGTREIEWGNIIWGPVVSLILIGVYFYTKKFVLIDFKWEKDMKSSETPENS